MTAFLLVYFFWGSTYLAIRIAVEHIPPFMLGGVRFLIAGILMLVYCTFSGRKISLSFSDAWRLALMGVLLLTGGNMLLAYSEEVLPSGVAALIVAIVPLEVALIESFVLKGERLRGSAWAGIFLGLGGLVVLFWPQLAPILLPGKAQGTADTGDDLCRRRKHGHLSRARRPAYGRVDASGHRRDRVLDRLWFVGRLHRLHMAARSCAHAEGRDLRLRESRGGGFSGLADSQRAH
jgi:uncharacterized membrane protein